MRVWFDHFFERAKLGAHPKLSSSGGSRTNDHIKRAMADLAVDLERVRRADTGEAA